MERGLRIFLFVIVVLLPTYLIRFGFGVFGTNLLELLVVAWLIAWFVVRRAHRLAFIKRLWSGTLYKYPLLLLLLAAAISVFVSPNTLSALGYLKSYFLIPILLFVALASEIRRDSAWLKSVVGSLGVSTAIISFYAVLQRIWHWNIPAPWDEGDIRVTSFFDYPNALALFVVPLGVLFFALSISSLSERAKNVFRVDNAFGGCWWTGAVVFLAALAAVLSESMGGIIAFSIGVLAVLFLSGRWQIATALILFAMLAVVIVPSVRNDVLSVVGGNDVSTDVRLVMWKGTWRMIKNNPLLGVGLGGFAARYVDYKEAAHIESLPYPHNIALNFWTETGLLGLIAFVWLLVAALRRTFIGHKSILFLGVLGFLVTIIIHGLVDAPYFKNDLALVFMIVLALTINKRTQSV